jgi:hypothetical protein
LRIVKRWQLPLFFFPVLTVGVSTGHPSLSLHVATAKDTTPCDDILVPLTCLTVDVSGDSSSVQYVYVLATGVEDSLLAAAFGIGYNPSTIIISRWHPCTDADEAHWLGEWPQADSEILMNWDPAEPKSEGLDGIAVIGALEVLRGAEGTLAIIVGPELGFAEITTTARRYDLRFGGHLGMVDLAGQGGGYNPCDSLVPVESHSWGTIKAIFK